MEQLIDIFGQLAKDPETLPQIDSRSSSRRRMKKEVEAARRKKVQEEMSDDKIDEIVKHLEVTTKNTTKKKKTGKVIKNAKAYSHKTNEIDLKIQSGSRIEIPIENSDLHEVKMIGDPKNADTILEYNLKHKMKILEKEKVYARSMENTNIQKFDKLSNTVANIEESKSRLLKEISEIDARKAQLLRSFEAKDIVLCRLRTEQNVLSRTMEESKAKISQMESEVEILESQQLGTKTTLQALPARPQNQDYLDSISLKIRSKEQDLECPVCLETATAPILMCEDQHLICNECRSETYLMSLWFVRIVS